MASNNEYKRYFIILQEDDKGYEMSPGKIPTGYVKIEQKNNKVKLNTFIQNVKMEERIEYRLILVASARNLAVDIGKIIIDGSGRGELFYELESDNVLKSSLNMGDFNVAAVTSGVSIPLSGFAGRDKPEWKGRYNIVNAQKPQDMPRIDKKIKIEEIMPGVPEKPVSPPIITEELLKEIPEMVPEVVPEMVPEVVPEIIPEPEPVVIISQPVIEINIPECPSIVPMEEPCEIAEEKIKCDDIHQYYCYDDEDFEKSENEKCKEYVQTSYYSGNMYDKMKKVLKRLRRYEPFEREKGYEWFRVGSDIFEINSVTVPYMGYMMPMGYPFISEGCSMMLERKDYILGIKYDDTEEDDDGRKRIRYLHFGVPAIYSRENEQYYKSRGFAEFRPHEFKGYGYFIMCLDLRNGMLCNMD